MHLGRHPGPSTSNRQQQQPVTQSLASRFQQQEPWQPRNARLDHSRATLASTTSANRKCHEQARPGWPGGELRALLLSATDQTWPSLQSLSCLSSWTLGCSSMAGSRSGSPRGSNTRTSQPRRCQHCREGQKGGAERYARSDLCASMRRGHAAHHGLFLLLSQSCQIPRGCGRTPRLACGFDPGAISL